MINKISLIEDHHEALTIWREKGFRGFDLVHVDAHIDFGFQQAKPIERIINEARNIKELKRNLEYTLAFMRYEKDFDKQTNIGNYIYPAMCEGIVKDFYWVIPGGLKEFKKSLKFLKGILKSFTKQNPYQLRCTLQATRYTLRNGIISTELLGRKFVICILEKLPILKEKVLLDIDTDFLIVDSLLNASNTAKIGKRRRWIRPDRLIKDLLNKEVKPVFITIAYSVNGGYTPMRHKILGDELVYRLSPKHFKEHYGQKFIASVFFERFESTGKKVYYQKAIKLDSSYRVANNNYGLLYLSIRKFSRAQREFLRIVNADPKNPYPFIGLGNIALEKRDFHKAESHFFYALKQKKNLPSALLGLAQAEFRLKNFKKAKKLFVHYQTLQPRQPQSRYFLGRIYERERDFERAAACYQDAMRLGLNDIDVISRLVRISSYIMAKDGIIQYAIMKYEKLRKGFDRAKRLSLKKGKEVKGLLRIEKKIVALEKRLQKEAQTDERHHSFTQEQGYGNKGDR